MHSIAERRRRPSSSTKAGDPPWNIALLYPPQGEWTESEFLWLERNVENQLIELNDGFLEVLPMPDTVHQAIVFYLAICLREFVKVNRLGEVLMAPLPVRLWDRQLREPDVLFLK